MYEVYCAKCEGPHQDGNHHHHTTEIDIDDVATDISTIPGENRNKSPSISRESKNKSEMTEPISMGNEMLINSHNARNAYNNNQPAFSPGKMVWVRMDDQSLAGAMGVSDWKRATVSSRYGDTLTLIPDYGHRKLQSGRFGEKSRYRVTGIEACSPANSSVQSDLTSLAYIHEPAILYNIKMRALWKQPYTFIGEVLISVNPLQQVGEVGLDFLRDPHPKTIAERALRRLRFGIKEKLRREIEEIRNEKYKADREKASSVSVNSQKSKSKTTRGLSAVKVAFKTLTKTLRSSTVNEAKKAVEKKESEGKEELKVNQAVIISGESGSGKTEAARRVLSQLVDGFELDDEEDGLQNRILASEPILESFGNARTVKNPNSSRFGKFLKIYYTIDEEDYVELRAAGISTYLLEISRVVRQGAKERNFRIFYNILSTPVLKFQESLGLVAADFSFEYINGKYKRERQDEVQYFELSEAFQSSQLGISWPNLLEVIAALLHLGNIKYGTKTTKAGDVADIELLKVNDAEYDALQWAAQMFGIEVTPLKQIILEKVVRAGGEEMIKTRTAKDAKGVTDSISKKVYTMAFDWLISKLNTSLIESDFSYKQLPFTNFVGILDVFGFEVFESNGLEQLLINYANEVLQLVFTEQVLIAESELFRKEGIIVDESVLPTTAFAEKEGPNRMHFFDQVFLTLDNTMRLPKATDERFANELQKKLKGQPMFVLPHRKDFGRKFVIRHFASKVEYTVGEFLIKNNDSLPEISHLFTFSTNPMLQQLPLNNKRENFKNELQREKSLGVESTGSSRRRKANKRKRKKSIFRASGNLSKLKSKKKGNPSLFSSTKGATSKRKITVSGLFKKQIRELSASLKRCGCSYIRCVKPNPFMTPPKVGQLGGSGENVGELYSFYGHEKAEMVLKARSFYKTGKHIKRRIGSHSQPVEEDGYFDADYVARQLHFLGVFDAVRVLKSGLPTRINYSTFMSTFQAAIPLESSPYLRNLDDGNPVKYRHYIAALLLAFRVPPASYRLGLTKVFFKFGQIDNIAVILNASSKWTSTNRRVVASFDGDINEDDLEYQMSQTAVTKRFHYNLVRMRWRDAYTKVRVFIVFKGMMKRNSAARVIQQVVRSYFDKKETMYKRMLDNRAGALQRVWRGYKGRKISRELRRERDQMRELEERKKEALRKKYLEKKRARTVEAFTKAQTRHRKQLTMEKMKLKRKQERIVAAMEQLREQKHAEAERIRLEEEKANELIEKLKQEKELKEVRRKRQIQKQQALEVLHQEIEINRAQLKEQKEIEEKEQNSKFHRQQTLNKEKKDELDLKSGVAEILRIEKKIEKIEEVEAVISEVSDSKDSLPVVKKASKPRIWTSARGSTFHKSTFATRMKIIRTDAPKIFLSPDSDTESTSSTPSLVEVETPQPTEASLKEHQKEQDAKVEEEPHPEHGFDLVNKGVFNTRYKILKEKVRQLSISRNIRGDKSSLKEIKGTNFMNEFTKQENIRLKEEKTKKMEELSHEINNFAKILEIELSLEDIKKEQKVEQAKGRKWKERVKKGVRYKNIPVNKFPVEKQSNLKDPKVLKNLEFFLKESIQSHSTKIFRCNNGNPRASYAHLNKSVNVVKAGENVKLKKRKVTLQKFSVSCGTLKVFDVKNSKRVCILTMKIDHKVKFTLDQDEQSKQNRKSKSRNKRAAAWGQSKARLFVLHVPTGNCVCFEFNMIKARNNWQAELRKAQMGFFGNTILDLKTKSKMSEVDKILEKSKDVTVALASINEQQTKINTTANPKFRKPNKIKDLIGNFEKNTKRTQVSDWTNHFLNIGKRPKSSPIPTKSGRKKV